MKEKKKLTLPEQKKKLSRLHRAIPFTEFASAITPFFVIGAVNYNDYFVEFDGARMSIACVLATMLAGIAVFLVSKKKLSDSFVTLVVGWYAAAFIFYLIGRIVNDIATIMFIGGSGLVGACVLDVVDKKKIGPKLQDVIKDMKAAESSLNQEEYKEQLKQAEETKKIKVRIKK